MTVHNGQELSLAIDGRERHLTSRLTPYVLAKAATGESATAGPVGSAESVGSAEPDEQAITTAIVGLGYVGLPTALALRDAPGPIIGLDIAPARLRAIEAGDVDLPPAERQALADVLAAGKLRLTASPADLAEADAIMICVPTPVDASRQPELSALRAACETVVTHARAGQTIVLTSTTYVGTTREFLVDPLTRRGMRVGEDVHVAFSPERIDPGNYDHQQRDTPRIVGGATAACSAAAARVIGGLTDAIYLVSSPEAAEATKLYENIFRAVSLALANEFADVCSQLSLDPIEVTLAAGTKPYGFLGAFPGPGVGGHCIPCDPHYLLWQLGADRTMAPLIERAMRSIDHRPSRVVERALGLLADSSAGTGADNSGADTGPKSGARIMVAGISYKSGVADLRESSAVPIITELRAAGANVSYYDPLLPTLTLSDGTTLTSEPKPVGDDWDLVLVHTVHRDFDYDWVADCPLVLDATYTFDSAPHRHVV